MTVIELREGDAPVELSLDPVIGQALALSGAVTAVPSLVPGRWSLASGSKVGVLRLGDVQVWIRPKIDIRRIVFMLGYAINPRGWRDEDVALASAPDLLTAVAYAFARQAARATQQGLLQGYRSVEEALPVLRGRIRETDQLRRRYAVPVPLEVRYDEFTVDIAENRLLRAATERLLRLPHLSLDVRRSLRRLLVTVADVSSLPAGLPPPRWHATRLNVRYHVALRLAELVLAAESFEQQRGSLRVGGFLFDMARIFEDFVCVALREALAPFGGRVELQFRTHLDEGAAVPMRPDLVWSQGSQALAVVDAKYKAEKPSGFPQADLYQMFAYTTVLGLDSGHLVYAQGNEEPAIHRIVKGGVSLNCHALDLDQDPVQVLGSIHLLAESLARRPLAATV